MMNCDRVIRAAGDHLENRSRFRERLMVLLHIAMCKGCRAFLEQFRLTMLGLRSLPQPVAVAVSEDLLERFRGHFRQRN